MSFATAPKIAHGAAPLGVVKRTEADFHDWIASEVGFASNFCNWNDDPLVLEAYQFGFMCDESSYRCAEKSRQTGYSFIFSVEALARSHLRESHTAIFVSYNLADAKEKIAYCRQLHEELPLSLQRKLVVDSKLELGFRANSGSGRVSRIISNPSKAPRGKTGDIYLDELAHCQNDREIYKGSTALILRSGGQLTICSSPLGRRGTFWEVAREEVKPYRAYSRQHIPWWLCRDFCKNVPRAANDASKMDTETRVREFGKPGIWEQYDSLLLEDFQQEFEVFYSDEAMTFFPYELILGCCVLDSEDLVEDFGGLNGARGRLVGGYDVGRKHDLSVLSIFEVFKDGRKRCRMLRVYEKAAFERQESDLRSLLTIASISRLSIDNTGMGIQLAENLQNEFPAIVVPETFTTTSKEVWATDFKIGLQRKEIELPRDRMLISHIHSIRRSVTSGGRVTFEVDSNESKGHADLFWSCALACQKERGPARELPSIGVRVIG